MTCAEERRELYRLIEGHCDTLLGCKNARQAIQAGANLRARATVLRAGRAIDQTTLEDPDGRE